jgi:hypothetical protein
MIFEHGMLQEESEPSIVMHTWNLSIQEVEVRGSRVQGQPGLCSKTCFKTETKQNNNKKGIRISNTVIDERNLSIQEWLPIHTHVEILEHRSINILIFYIFIKTLLSFETNDTTYFVSFGLWEEGCFQEFSNPL